MFRTNDHTLALTSLLFLAMGALFASSASAGVNADEIVDAHNQWRQSVGSPPLRWSNQLADVAQKWADRLASEGAIRHSTSGYGENLFAISGRRATGREAVDAWGSEIEHFKNGVFPDVSTTGNWADVGHYTQVVWRSTTEVGCAMAGSAEFEVWVCNYDPAGNVMGRSPFDQDKPADSSSSANQSAGSRPKPENPSVSADGISGRYFRLTTQWQGDEKSLDVVNDGKNNQVELRQSGNFSGQYWKLTSVGNGYYRLTTRWQGDEKSLDVVNDGKNNNQVELRNTGDYAGQFWKLTPVEVP